MQSQTIFKALFKSSQAGQPNLFIRNNLNCFEIILLLHMILPQLKTQMSISLLCECNGSAIETVDSNEEPKKAVHCSLGRGPRA